MYLLSLSNHTRAWVARRAHCFAAQALPVQSCTGGHPRRRRVTPAALQSVCRQQRACRVPSMHMIVSTGCPGLQQGRAA